MLNIAAIESKELVLDDVMSGKNRTITSMLKANRLYFLYSSGVGSGCVFASASLLITFGAAGVEVWELYRTTGMAGRMSGWRGEAIGLLHRSR